MNARVPTGATQGAWEWSLSLEQYDRSPALSENETTALAVFRSTDLAGRLGRVWTRGRSRSLSRLLQPIDDYLAAAHRQGRGRGVLIALFCSEMARRGTSFWAWAQEEWAEVLRSPQADRRTQTGKMRRVHVAAFPYLIGGLTDPLCWPGWLPPVVFARVVFGRARVDAVIASVRDQLCGWGLMEREANQTDVRTALCAALLYARSPLLRDIQADHLERVRRANAPRNRARKIVAVSRVLADLGSIGQPLERLPPSGAGTAMVGVPGVWVDLVNRWCATTTLEISSRRVARSRLLTIGRWIAANYPDAVTPEKWSRQIAASFVAAVERLRIGDWSGPGHKVGTRRGDPVRAGTKQGYLNSLRRFLQDYHEWEWGAIPFDPRRALTTPRSIQAQLGPNPRVLADDVWAKLLWAGLNLEEADLPRGAGESDPFYPLALVRAVVLVWLFGGLRSDEIRRLRIGCIRRQHGDDGSFCYLTVPVNKTSAEFVKAIDVAVGDAIEAWERVRPVQPTMIDQKTGERVHFLFAYRTTKIGELYLNDSVIPMLCRKAGVPTREARGNITSHRARSTIASQLASAREPLSLFELMEWLGHRHPASTLHYVKTSPTKQVKALEKAGYFERNVRTIDVLVNREKLRGQTGAAAHGLYYDLVHGWCTNEFFAQCPHRLACARCPFYLPKDSEEVHVLAAEGNLIRLRQDLLLTDEERLVIDGDVAAYRALRQRMWDVATPAGPKPSELGETAHTDDMSK
jgi:integrase